MSRRLRMTMGQYVRVCHQAIERWPNEACGIALGHIAAGRVESLWRVDNTSDTPIRRYQMDHQQQIDVYRQADVLGLDPVMVWHSHTRASSTPHPSASDLANAHDSRILHLILVCSNEAVTDHQLWEITDGHPTAAQLELT